MRPGGDDWTVLAFLAGNGVSNYSWLSGAFFSILSLWWPSPPSPLLFLATSLLLPILLLKAQYSRVIFMFFIKNLSCNLLTIPYPHQIAKYGKKQRKRKGSPHPRFPDFYTNLPCLHTEKEINKSKKEKKKKKRNTVGIYLERRASIKTNTESYQKNKGVNKRLWKAFITVHWSDHLTSFFTQ